MNAPVAVDDVLAEMPEFIIDTIVPRSKTTVSAADVRVPRNALGGRSVRVAETWHSDALRSVRARRFMNRTGVFECPPQPSGHTIAPAPELTSCLTNVCGHEGAREEEWARRMMSAALDAEVTCHDDGSLPGMYDLDIGDVGAVEITAAIEPEAHTLWKHINDRDHRWADSRITRRMDHPP